jgi:hypothetical protein
MRRRTVLLIAPSAQGLHLTRRALEEASAHHTVQVVRDGEAAMEYLRLLPTSPRESRFSLAYSHPYERHPMTWRQSCRSRPHCTRNIN